MVCVFVCIDVRMYRSMRVVCLCVWCVMFVCCVSVCMCVCIGVCKYEYMRVLFVCVRCVSLCVL